MTMFVHISPFDPARTMFVAAEAQLAVIEIACLSFTTRRYMFRDVMQFILHTGSVCDSSCTADDRGDLSFVVLKLQNGLMNRQWTSCNSVLIAC